MEPHNGTRNPFPSVLVLLSLATPLYSRGGEELGRVQPGPRSEDQTSRYRTMTLEELLGVEITSASKIPQPTRAAPSIVSVITAEQIREFSWASINEILFAQPGFLPSQDYERVTVGARGLFESWNNNHLLLLIDGVPVNDNETGGAYTWEITPLVWVETVEIIRGPGSALYGSSAMNGVVTLNTRGPAKEAAGALRLQGGNHGAWKGEAWAGLPTEPLALSLAASAHSTRGNEYLSYDGSGRTDASGTLQQFRVQDSRDGHYLFAKMEGREALSGLSLQLHQQAWSFETGHGWLWQIPDVGESMRESRQMAIGRYRPEARGRLGQEYVARYQRHNLHHDNRFLPMGAFDNTYPGGVSEFLETHVEDVFGRAQFSWKLKREALVLGGIEHAAFFYGGDDKHYSNAALSDAAGGYPPLPGPEPLGPYYEWIKGKPVQTFSVFGQFTSGGLLGPRVGLTLGARYDGQFFDYVDITDPERAEGKRTFEQLSPRIGLVVSAGRGLSLKALAGRAFRAPAPVELFGANTWALASNLKNLKAERVTTYELGADWAVKRELSWRTNVFYLELDNQIAYGSLNLLTNIYSHATAGVETELLFAVDLGGMGKARGFGSVSYVKLLDEEVQDPSIAPETNRGSWIPSHSAKAGVVWSRGRIEAALSALHMGKALRRSSDRLNPVNGQMRSAEVGPWLTLDTNLNWRFSPDFRAGLRVTNLLNTRAYLIKTGDFPFDYQIQGRRIVAGVEVNLD